jgi:HEAT repeat protein
VSRDFDSIANRITVATILIFISLFVLDFLFGWRIEMWKHKRAIAQMEIWVEMANTAKDNREPIASLVEVLRSGDVIERTAAAACLGKVGPRAASAVDALAATRCDWDNGPTAEESAGSLGEMGTAARRAIPALIQAMQQFPDDERSCVAAETLGRISDPNDQRVRAALIAASHSEDKNLRSSAEHGLKKLESAGDQSTTEPGLQF